LQKVEVEADNLYQIDQILIRRTKSKVKEVRVSWLGWPKKKLFMDLRKYYKKKLKIKHLCSWFYVLKFDQFDKDCLLLLLLFAIRYFLNNLLYHLRPNL
jgi:hypothetical protein